MESLSQSVSLQYFGLRKPRSCERTSKVVYSLLAEASGQHRVRLDMRGVRQLQDIDIGIAHDAEVLQ